MIFKKIKNPQKYFKKKLKKISNNQVFLKKKTRFYNIINQIIKKMKKLIKNLEKNKTTDVLSFPLKIKNFFLKKIKKFILEI